MNGSHLRPIGFGICLAVLASLGGCILVPGGEGRGGREHDDHERRDKGDEHRHDFGVNPTGHWGLYQPYAVVGAIAPAHGAVLLSATRHRRQSGAWS